MKLFIRFSMILALTAYIILTCWVIRMQSANVVVIPFSYDSHTLSFIQISKQLRQRHSVTYVVSTAAEFRSGELEDLQVHRFQSQITVRDLRRCKLASRGNSYETPCLREAYQEADALLSDKIVQKLAQDADILFCDFSFFGCSLLSRLVNASLQIDINLAGFLDPGMSSYYKIPNPLAYIPQYGTGLSTTNMKFSQRLYNFWIYWLSKIQFLVVAIPKSYTIMTKHFNHTVDMATPKSSLLLLGTDFAIEYPRPYTPYTKLVGPILAEIPQTPLDEQLRKVISISDRGFVLASFSYDRELLQVIDTSRLQEIINAFSQLPYTVLWRFSGVKLPKLPNNVYQYDWLPQNTLLSNKKIRAFITHCVTHDVQQAAFHGVPIIGLPISNSEFYISHKIQHAGIGVFTSMETVTTKWLVANIERVVEDKDLKNNNRRVTKILQDRPNGLTATQEVAYWVDYVIKHQGGKHLKTRELEMNWITAGNYDLYILLFGIGYILWKFVWILVTLCMDFLFGRKVKTD